MRERPSLYSLNRGIISRLGVARVDVKRLALAAEDQTNWMPRVLGSMSLRAGLGYVGNILNDAPCRMLKFVFATDDTALLELTSAMMRIWINDALLTRPSVTAAVANSSFTSNVNSWTDKDESGATSAWVSPGYLELVGNGSASAIREQKVTINEVGVEHGIRITIERGPVVLSIGSTSGGDEYFFDDNLNVGTHSISVVPTGDIYIRFASSLLRKIWVDSCSIEAVGVVEIPTPWTDLDHVRTDQSGDVLFVACKGVPPRRIERRGERPGGRSWSVAMYANDNGPFQVQNVTKTTMTPSVLSGNATITASKPVFKIGHIGSLVSITSIGQSVTTSAALSAIATDSIRVAGTKREERNLSLTISGNDTSSVVDLQRSYDDTSWTTLVGKQWTTSIADNYDDNLDGQIVFYRLILTTRNAPDTVVMSLNYTGGAIRGTARITDFTSSTVVSAEILTPMGGTDASDTWQMAEWSTEEGWPTAVRIHEGRLWWSGLNGVWGSVSDAFDSFDESVVGASGPINRTIGAGPVDTINWLLSLKGLIVGAQGAEFTVRASSLDEPLTPTNFNMKQSSTQGSGAVDAIKIDGSGYFVNRSSTKVCELAFDVRNYDYAQKNLMELCPDIAIEGIVRIDVQRLPDSRLHCVLADGTVLCAVSNTAEEVLAWIPIETDGFIEEVVVLPAANKNLDDQTYYVVKRTINGATKRYLEKFAQEQDCYGNPVSYLADSHLFFAQGGVITGLGHLEGCEVVVWGDGRDLGTDDTVTPWVQRYTVTGGKITLPTSSTNVTVGLGYTAKFKSAKLGMQPQGGTSLNQQKIMNHIGLILDRTHKKGVRFGPDPTILDDMPMIEDGTTLPVEVPETYDQNLIEFPGTWTTDLRVCIHAQAPRPATVLAITPDIKATG